MNNIRKLLPSYKGYLHILICSLLLPMAMRAADPVAFSNEALTAPALADFGDLSDDATYVFFFNAVKGGASTAIAGNDAVGIKLEQWNETGSFGVTEFGVVDNVFEPDGSGEPDSVFEEDVHVAIVNDWTNEEVRLYVNGQLSGYYVGNFELFGEVKLMAARLATDGDAMAGGSILYSWATYDEALSADEISDLAANAEPTTPAEPEDPNTVIASSTFASASPTAVNFGTLSGDATYVFYLNASKGGASTAIAGNDAAAIKLDQWNNQGVFGTTQFGVADNLFEAVGGKSVASVFDRVVHVVIVSDSGAGESRLYVDGDHVGTWGGNFELPGSTKVMGARLEQATDHMGAGSVMYSWATYSGVLSGDEIAAKYDALPPVKPPVTARIDSIALTDGSVVIEYEGTLMSADSVNGPYNAVAGATSPYSVAPDQGAQFFIAQ